MHCLTILAFGISSFSARTCLCFHKDNHYHDKIYFSPMQVKLEDVFPMVAGQHMGSPFSHSAHIYQSRLLLLKTHVKFTLSNILLFQAQLHPWLPHDLCGHPPSTAAERRDNGHSEDGS